MRPSDQPCSLFATRGANSQTPSATTPDCRPASPIEDVPDAKTTCLVLRAIALSIRSAEDIAQVTPPVSQAPRTVNSIIAYILRSWPDSARGRPSAIRLDAGTHPTADAPLKALGIIAECQDS